MVTVGCQVVSIVSGWPSHGGHVQQQLRQWVQLQPGQLQQLGGHTRADAQTPEASWCCWRLVRHAGPAAGAIAGGHDPVLETDCP
ncbi:MAG: hypothetical protein EBV32_03690 [Proteobacteria bacterium]|uniref:Uncharacterized protein n=1 Tax=Candidatus Fonsibacter lacus TaxID=2576439 RepID=A0A964XQP0_9PROT|nr:hypothetical protein [Candidatus Fonsibacter lacus]NCU72233.1 hypothetical protein [Candidatus Fonsibacter lacus]